MGAALFGAAEMGLWLALAQAAGQLLLGLLLRGRFAEDAELLPALPEREREAPVRAAVASVLQVCGYMALFSVAAAMAAKLLGGAAGDLLLYIADMPSGLARVAQTGAPWALAGAVAGFGGLCIAAQNMAVLRPLGVRWRDYLAARGFVAAVCALALHLRFSARVAAAPAMARLETGALEASTLAAMTALAARAAGRGLRWTGESARKIKHLTNEESVQKGSKSVQKPRYTGGFVRWRGRYSGLRGEKKGG